jgi:hypothetical protein
LIPWHSVGRDCVDTDKTLAPEIKDTFEAEANLFASEVIFQGGLFTDKVRDYTPSFNAIFTLADQHGASRQATLWRFTETYDLPIASLTYYRSDWNQQFRLWKPVGSERFVSKFGDIQLPQTLETNHPWTTAKSDEIASGDIRLADLSGKQHRFIWQSWWNGHALFVLIRARPKISLALTK